MIDTTDLKGYENQHVIPKFYLKKWHNKYGKMYEFNKENSKIVVKKGRSAKKIACSDVIWSPDTEKDKVGPADGRLSEELQNFKKYRKKSSKIWIARLIFNLLVRTGRLFNDKRYIDPLIKSPWYKDKQEASKSLRSCCIKQLSDGDWDDKTVGALKDYKMIMGINESNKDLMASDSIVVFEGCRHYREKPGIRHGNATKLIFPISPKEVIILYDPLSFPNIKDLEIEDITCVDTINRYNTLQTWQSKKIIYFKAESEKIANKIEIEIRRKIKKQYKSKNDRLYHEKIHREQDLNEEARLCGEEDRLHNDLTNKIFNRLKVGC